MSPVSWGAHLYRIVAPIHHPSELPSTQDHFFECVAVGLLIDLLQDLGAYPSAGRRHVLQAHALAFGGPGARRNAWKPPMG